MEVKTRFDKGDFVYFMNKNVIKKGRVCAIKVFDDISFSFESKIEIYYRLLEENDKGDFITAMDINIEESELSSSPSELLEDLEAKFLKRNEEDKD